MQSSLLVYECEGEEKEIKEWFKTINIVGIPLKEQELLKDVYKRQPYIWMATGRSSSLMFNFTD